MLYQRGLACLQTKRAMNRYHRQHHSNLFDAAIKDKSNGYANALIDEAMALCGHPWYKLSHRRWGEKAKEYLWWFVQQD